MNDSQQPNNKPTSSQLRYLRSLAERCGESFAYPTTIAEASAEIDRLKNRKRTSSADRRREVTQVRRAMGERGGDSAKVRPVEITGYGSGATWR